MMILLTVRMNDVNVKKTEDGSNPFESAWFRLQNEDTNQTIDYSYIEKVKKANGIEDEDDAAAENPESDDEQSKKETIFLAGRLYRADTVINPNQTLTPRSQGESDAPGS